MNPSPRKNHGLQPARAADVEALVDVHLRSFPGFFLTCLGDQFLGELYLGILADSTGVAWVARDGECIIGFAAGTLEPAGFYSRLIKRRALRFALAAVKPLLRRPAIFLRLWRAFRKPAESKSIPEGTSWLMSVAVDPSAQNQGVGKMLVEVFCDECARRGARRVCLTTDRDNNDQVNRFYARMGFVITRTFTTPENRPMNEYTRTLSAKAIIAFA